jgi:hypothetical protein
MRLWWLHQGGNRSIPNFPILITISWYCLDLDGFIGFENEYFVVEFQKHVVTCLIIQIITLRLRVSA